MPLWAKIDAGFHRNPKVRRAGRDGREVYLWLLLTNRAHDFDGSIPAGYSDPKYIARELEMRPGLVSAALSRCVEAGLIVMTAESVVTLCGWDGDWRTQADDSRERVRRHRANQRKIIEGGNGAVTVGNGVTAPRVEKSREEKSITLSPVGDQPALIVVPPTPKPPRPRKEPTGDHAEFIRAWDALYAAKTGGCKATWDVKSGAAVKALLDRHGLTECVTRATRLFRSPPAWLANGVPTIGTLRVNFDALAVAVDVPPPRAYNGRG